MYYLIFRLLNNRLVKIIPFKKLIPALKNPDNIFRPYIRLQPAKKSHTFSPLLLSNRHCSKEVARNESLPLYFCLKGVNFRWPVFWA